jgi:receptor protein-tyrosine kinase
MDVIQEFFRVVRHRILAIGLLTLVGVGAAALWVARSPAEYVATTRLFISGATATSQYDAQQGGMYAQDRVISYEKLVNSRALAQRTIDALGLDMDATTLASRVTATSFPDAAVMDVSVTADSPKQSRDVANGLANQFIALASTLETPPDSATPVVRLTVIDPAEDGTPAQILPAKLIYIFGGVVGLLAGLIIAFVRENYVRYIRDASDVQAATGQRPLADLPATTTDLKPTSGAEAREATARLRVSISTADGSLPHTVALASISGKSDELVRRFTAEAAANLVAALEAEKRKAVLLMLDSSPDVAARIARCTRKARKKSGRQVTIKWGFDDDSPGTTLLDREAIAEHLQRLRSSYEHVIVVLPPLSQFAHAAAAAPTVDGVVAVGIYHLTRQRDLDEHMAEIRRLGATSLGFTFARRTLLPHRSAQTATLPTEPSAPTTSRVVTETDGNLRRIGVVSSDGQRESVRTENSSPSLGLTVR